MMETISVEELDRLESEQGKVTPVSSGVTPEVADRLSTVPMVDRDNPDKEIVRHKNMATFLGEKLMTPTYRRQRERLAQDTAGSMYAKPEMGIIDTVGEFLRDVGHAWYEKTDTAIRDKQALAGAEEKIDVPKTVLGSIGYQAKEGEFSPLAERLVQYFNIENETEKKGLNTLLNHNEGRTLTDLRDMVAESLNIVNPERQTSPTIFGDREYDPIDVPNLIAESLLASGVGSFISGEEGISVASSAFNTLVDIVQRTGDLSREEALELTGEWVSQATVMVSQNAAEIGEFSTEQLTNAQRRSDPRGIVMKPIDNVLTNEHYQSGITYALARGAAYAESSIMNKIGTSVQLLKEGGWRFEGLDNVVLHPVQRELMDNVVKKVISGFPDGLLTYKDAEALDALIAELNPRTGSWAKFTPGVEETRAFRSLEARKKGLGASVANELAEASFDLFCYLTEMSVVRGIAMKTPLGAYISGKPILSARMTERVMRTAPGELTHLTADKVIRMTTFVNILRNAAFSGVNRALSTEGNFKDKLIAGGLTFLYTSTPATTGALLHKVGYTADSIIVPIAVDFISNTIITTGVSYVPMYNQFGGFTDDFIVNASVQMMLDLGMSLSTRAFLDSDKAIESVIIRDRERYKRLVAEGNERVGKTSENEYVSIAIKQRASNERIAEVLDKWNALIAEKATGKREVPGTPDVDPDAIEVRGYRDSEVSRFRKREMKEVEQIGKLYKQLSKLIDKRSALTDEINRLEQDAQGAKGKVAYHYSDKKIEKFEDVAGGTWFTSNEKGYSRRAKSGVQNEVVIPDSLNLATKKQATDLGLYAGDKEAFTANLKANGFDGVKMSVDGETHYMVLEPSKLSQAKGKVEGGGEAPLIAEEALIQEAKKYKRAEEFVKGQRDDNSEDQELANSEWFHGYQEGVTGGENKMGEGLYLTKNKDIALNRYGGGKNLGIVVPVVKNPLRLEPKIRKKGYIKKLVDDKSAGGVYETYGEKEIADIVRNDIGFSKFAENENEIKKLGYAFRELFKELGDGDWNSNIEFFDTAIEKLGSPEKARELVEAIGFDSILFNRGSGDSLLVFDKNKTESQLTDIWNKAQGKVEGGGEANDPKIAELKKQVSVLQGQETKVRNELDVLERKGIPDATEKPEPTPEGESQERIDSRARQRILAVYKELKDLIKQEDALNKDIEKMYLEGKPTRKLEKQQDELLNKIRNLEIERDTMISTVGKPREVTLEQFERAQLDSIEKQIKQFKAGLKAGGQLTLKDVRAFQNYVQSVVKLSSGLTVKQQRDLTRLASKVDTKDKLDKALSIIWNKVAELKKENERDIFVKASDRLLEKAKKAIGSKKFTPETSKVFTEAIKARNSQTSEYLNYGPSVLEMILYDVTILNRSNDITAEQARAVYNDLEAFYNSGAATKEMIKQYNDARNDTLIVSALADIQGEGKELLGGTDTDIKEGRKKVSLGQKIMLGSLRWGVLMSGLVRHSSDARGTSILERFTDMFYPERHAQAVRKRYEDAKYDMFGRIYGTKNKNEVFDKVTKDLRDMVEITVDMIVKDPGSKEETIHPKKDKVSRTVARQRKMEWDQPEGKKRLQKRSGYTEKTMEQIEDFLTAQDYDLMRELRIGYDKMYSEVNAVYREVQGVDLPYRANYSPFVPMRMSDKEAELNVLEQLHVDAGKKPTVGGKSFLKEIGDISRLDTIGDVFLYDRYVADMSHYIGFAKTLKDVNTIFNDSRIQEAIVRRDGQKVLDTIRVHINTLSRGKLEASLNGLFSGIHRFISRWYIATLGLDAKRIAVQFLSAGLYLTEMSGKEFAYGILDLPRAYASGDIEVITKNMYMLDRGVSSRDMKMALDAITEQQGEFQRRFIDNPRLNDISMFMLKAGDRGAIIMGAWGLYRHYTDKMKLPPVEALDKVLRFVNDSQQSKDLSQMSAILMDGSPLVRAFTMYVHTPQQYLNNLWDALVSSGRMGKGQLAKTVAAYMGMSLAYTIVQNAGKISLTSASTALLAGPIASGIPFIRDVIPPIIAAVFAQIYGEKQGASFSYSPIQNFSQDVVSVINTAAEMAEYGVDADTMIDLARSLGEMSAPFTGALGSGIKAMSNVARGIQHYVDYDDIGYMLGKFAGYTDSQLKD